MWKSPSKKNDQPGSTSPAPGAEGETEGKSWPTKSSLKKESSLKPKPEEEEEPPPPLPSSEEAGTGPA